MRLKSLVSLADLMVLGFVGVTTHSNLSQDHSALCVRTAVEKIDLSIR